MIAMENPELDYCPILCDLVPLLLHYLTEEETYVAIHLMMKVLFWHCQLSIDNFLGITTQ